MTIRIKLLGAAVALSLAACASPYETSPPRTATEQLLMARATQQAVSQFAMALPKGSKVYLDTSYFNGEGSDFAASCLREAILTNGNPIANVREQADIIVEARIGTLSIDRTNRVVGLPRVTLPISSAMTTVSIPELSVYSRRERRGVAEFWAFAYEQASGKPVALGSRVAGMSRVRGHTVLMIFTMGPQEIRPQLPPQPPSPWWKELW